MIKADNDKFLLPLINQRHIQETKNCYFKSPLWTKFMRRLLMK
jgi:hypothetical protein